MSFIKKAVTKFEERHLKDLDVKRLVKTTGQILHHTMIQTIYMIRHATGYLRACQNRKSQNKKFRQSLSATYSILAAVEYVKEDYVEQNCSLYQATQATCTRGSSESLLQIGKIGY